MNALYYGSLQRYRVSMMANPQHYVRPTTLDEALHAIREPGSLAFAGGGMLLRTLDPPFRIAIDLQAIPQLTQVKEREDGLEVGGAVTMQALLDAPGVPPALLAAITRTLRWNQRTGMSIGEVLITSDAPPEFVAMLVAMGAQVAHAGYLKGDISGGLWRETVVDFRLTLARRAYAYEGFVTAVYLPVKLEGARFGSAFVARTPRDQPIVNAAAHVVQDDAGALEQVCVVVFGASSPGFLRLELSNLAGLQPGMIDWSVVRAQVEAAASPVGDYLGSEAYRRRMAGLIAVRALQDALQGRD
jgi:aerobic carbon-monoxide dehydrogenase medium subunit